MESGISVIITVYNKAEYLTDTIRSVLNQSFTDFELILWNDGSTDNSQKVIDTFRDVRIKKFEDKNRGVSEARNRAVKQAAHHFLAFLDADDQWLPDHLEELNRMRSTYDNASFFATNSKLIIGDKTLERNYSLHAVNTIQEVDFFEASMRDSIVNSSTIGVYREAFDAVGGFDPSLKSGEDTDLFIRLGFNYSVVFSPRVTSRIYRTPDSLSQTATDLAKKPDFSAYAEEEKQRPAVKAYLDLNRYALCLQARLNQDEVQFDRFYQQLDVQNLNKKQRFLLGQSKDALIKLKKLQDFGRRLGFRWGAF
ncbi:glycosyltransferase family 2 protein [Aureitalea marina]|uniref:Glycosyltransferase 2-like domain-containing protein n=1 Tax=Aureitalea marina TaxID=930804 RepID=A0A2S7KQD7_9FLAO|nr:glycosyltransferase family A protein [Aureitalea marina]PQB04842.1 hypothetical protein BST85_08000 [Aureitalea marina]